MSAQTPPRHRATAPPHIALFLILPSRLIERNVPALYRQIQRFIAGPVF
ncbi:MAG TPA: hypothetical protein VGF38_24080 [Ktedonobacterales bacterium]